MEVPSPTLKEKKDENLYSKKKKKKDENFSHPFEMYLQRLYS